MAQPHKGARRGFVVRWREADRARVHARAEEVGLTMNEYVLALIKQDLDGLPAPVWEPPAVYQDELPGLRQTA